MLFEDLHLSISHVLALGAGIINTHIVDQNQATKSNRNLTNDLHQSRPAHLSESSSQSVTFMLDGAKKMHLYQSLSRKFKVEKKTKGLAACESQLLFIQKVSREVGTEPPHCDGQYMVSHSSVGEQSRNAEDKNNSTQW